MAGDRLNVVTGARGTGFIAPFASLELTLIHIRTRRGVRHVRASGAKVYPIYVSTNAGSPWDILPTNEKVRRLVEVIDSTIRQAIPKLLDGS